MAYAFSATSDAFASASGTVQTISWTPVASDSAVTLSLSTGTTGTWTQSDATDGAMNKIGAERTVASAVIGVCFYHHVLSAGTRNLTSTRSAAGTNRTVAYWRYTGLSNVAPQTSLYPTACSPSTTTDGTTTGNVTPTSQPAMLFGLCIDPNSGFSLTSGTGFSSRGQMANRNTGVGDTSNAEDKRLTATSAVACTWTAGGTSATPNWAAAIVFTEDTGGATTFTTLVGPRFSLAGPKGLAG